MIRSDGNGSYVVDKKLWAMMMAVIGLLAGVVVWGGQEVVADVKDNTLINAVQDAKINEIIKRFDRFEAKLDDALRIK